MARVIQAEERLAGDVGQVGGEQLGRYRIDPGCERFGRPAGDARWYLVTDAVSVVGRPGDFDVDLPMSAN